MSALNRVAVVTGANKGIGYAITKSLCNQFGGDVVLTARDVDRGEQAVKQLDTEGVKVKFHQLDLNDVDSAVRLRDWLESEYGGVDVLVNNAGIAYKMNSTAPFGEQAEVTMKTNFLGTLAVFDTLRPLLRRHARVVNVSSMSSFSALSNCSREVWAHVLDANLTMDKLKDLMAEFVRLSIDGTHVDHGWPNSAYGASKMAVTAMTFIQQRELDAASADDLLVNCCCPGYVDTDMTSHKGHKTIEQGAETPVMLALIPPNASSPRGQFLSEKKVKQWV